MVELVRNASTTILIAWWCIGSSFLVACRVVHDKFIVHLSSYYCSVCQQQGVHICTPVQNLNPVFSGHFWRLFRLLYSKVWAVSGFFPLHIIVRSSTNKNLLTGLDGFVTSFMVMRNRLRTDPCGTPFSIVLDEERQFAILTQMVFVWRKFLMKLKMLFPCFCRIFKIRYLHTISYAFSMSRHTAVKCYWLAKDSCILVSRLIK